MTARNIQVTACRFLDASGKTQNPRQRSHFFPIARCFSEQKTLIFSWFDELRLQL